MSPKLEDFDVLGIIGSGSTGTCYKVRNKYSNELFVWKAVDYGNLTEDHKEMLVSEVNLLKSLNHPHIVKYCGRILHKETTTLYIITEWCEGGDLNKVIKNARDTGKYLEEQFIWRMLYQISRALQVCHSRLKDFTIFHRDIKPSNVFLDHNGNAKLGDFGLARIVSQDHEFSATVVGTPYYMSPELVKGLKYNRKSDIWSLGCLVYELCALAPPFTGSSIVELADTIKKGKYKSIPAQYSDNLKKVISFMLSTKHEFRPTIEMILHHPSVVVNIKDCCSSTKLSYPSSITTTTFGDNNHDRCFDQSSDTSGMENLTLIDPEFISRKVFKDKWAEKHEALREKEAWLKRREKSICYKEQSIANRVKQLQLLEIQAKERHCLTNQHLFKRKEISDLHDQAGQETDVSVEPFDTPIRPTSAKLDPNRLPRPEILTNASRLLDKQTHLNSTKPINSQQLIPVEQQISKFSRQSSSNVRRSLILNKGSAGRVKNKITNNDQQSKDLSSNIDAKLKIKQQSSVSLPDDYKTNQKPLSTLNHQKLSRHNSKQKDLSRNIDIGLKGKQQSTVSLPDDHKINQQQQLLSTVNHQKPDGINKVQVQNQHDNQVKLMHRNNSNEILRRMLEVKKQLINHNCKSSDKENTLLTNITKL